MNEKKNIDDFLGQQFEGFEVRPSAGSFNQFMEKLEAAQEKKKRRSAFYLLSWGLAAAVMIVMGVYVYNEHTKPGTLAVAKQEEQATTQTSVQAHTDSNPATHGKPTRTVTPQQSKTSIPTPEKRLAASAMKNPVPETSFINKAPIPVTSQGNSPVGTNSSPANENPTPDVPQGMETPAVVTGTPPTSNTALVAANVDSGDEKNLRADYLNPLSGNATSFLGLRIVSDDVLTKDLVRLQRLRHQARFFIGVSCEALLGRSSYRENKNSNVERILYSEDFAGKYVRNREAESATRALVIPGVRFGVATRRVEVYANIGYYQLREWERVYLPKDSIFFNSTNGLGSGLTPLGNPGGSGNSTTAVHPSNLTALQDQVTYTNQFRYFYGSLGVSGLLHYYSFRVKPGIQMTYNKITKSEYISVGALGYQQIQGGTEHLNPHVFSLALHCSFSRTIARGLELQVGPIYRMSLSSVFNEQYFTTQHYKAFGLEGALIYKFPAKLKN